MIVRRIVFVACCSMLPISFAYALEGTGFYLSATGLHRIDFSSGSETQILSGWDVKTAGLSPDSKHILFNSNGGKQIIDISGGNLIEVLPSVPLPDEHYRIWWSRLGVYRMSGGELERYEPESGQKSTILSVNNPGSGGGVQVNMDGTRAWSRAKSYGRTFGPKGYYTEAATYYHVEPGGASGTYFSQSSWGHGEGITLWGRRLLHVVFGSHDGVWIRRTSDGQGVRQIYWEQGSYQARFANCANHNAWVGMTLDGGNKTTLLNWKTNTQIEVPMPSGGKLFGFWLGNDIPSVNDNAAYILAYTKKVKFNILGRTSPWEKSVALTNIGNDTLDRITVTIEPSSASSWLSAAISGSGNERTLTLTVTPSGVPGTKDSAQVKLDESSARNTEVVNVIADKAFMPEVTNYVVTSANPTDSFEYAAMSWVDNAESEEGYIIEYNKESWNNGQTQWTEVGRTGPNETTFVHNLLATNYDRGNGAYYRVRPYDSQDNTSEDIADWANFQPFDVQLNYSGPAAMSTHNAGDSVTITWESNVIKHVDIHYSIDGGSSWTAIEEQIKKDDNQQWGTHGWTLPATTDGKAVYLRIKEWPIDVMASIGGPLLVGDVDSSQITSGIEPKAPRQHASAIEFRGDMLIAQVKGNRAYNLFLYDASGAVVLEAAGKAGEQLALPASGLMPGVYLVRLRSGPNVMMAKIAVKK
ncbi:MAG: hypothetical protein GF398_16925 [Chitinivibrionales bacterium]|nr:hypothetical protein [Chitinivibrionales bacterium]